MLCNGQLNDENIYTITALRLRCFHDESDKFPAGFLQRFINLKKLYVTCSSFTDIFSRDNHEFICQEKSEVQPVIQSIETLCLYKCSRLKEVVPSSMLFESLEQLEVGNCAGLKNILKSSTVANLPKLRRLCIDGCDKIEEIVASEDENDASELALMKLRYLRLTNLPRLSSFCKGKHDFKFPLLWTLFVISCPVMETFSHGMLNAPKLVEVRITPQDEWEWNGDINTTIKKMQRKW